MKGIYFFESIDSAEAKSVGIEKKIDQQINCLKSIGDLTVVNVKFNWGLKEKIAFLLPFIKSQRRKRKISLVNKVSDDTDYIYIRKPSLDNDFYVLLKKIKKKFPKIFIMMEIPTYPFYSEYTGLSKLMIIKSLRCEMKLKRVIDRIMTYSDDSEIWGIPTIRISNCVSYKDIPPRNKKYKPILNTIRLTCVARFMYWHGLDRLIKGIREYNGKYNIILNIVGNGQEINNLKKLSKGMKNIIFHGVKTGVELDRIFDETDIAVDALGRHRSGVTFNSSLKGKEYVARGIPVISAVKTELDNMNNFRYYLKLPADESYINIKDIVRFFEKIYLSEKPNTVTEDIRLKTEAYFDYKNGFEKVIASTLSSRNRL